MWVRNTEIGEISGLCASVSPCHQIESSAIFLEIACHLLLTSTIP